MGCICNNSIWISQINNLMTKNKPYSSENPNIWLHRCLCSPLDDAEASAVLHVTPHVSVGWVIRHMNEFQAKGFFFSCTAVESRKTFTEKTIKLAKPRGNHKAASENTQTKPEAEDHRQQSVRNRTVFKNPFHLPTWTQRITTGSAYLNTGHLWQYFSHQKRSD